MPLRKAFLSGLFAGAWLWLIPFAGAQPRQVSFSSFNAENGLPDNQTRNIIQDHDGYMWVGRTNGMTKYDGYNFTNYRHIPGDSTTISGNVVMNIYEDSKGRLWVSPHLKGVDLSDQDKKSFRRVQLQPDSLKDVDMNVGRIAEDQQGRMWLATNEGMVVLQEHEGTFRRIDLDTLVSSPGACGFPVRPITHVVCASNGVIYMGNGEGLTAYDPKTRRLICPMEWTGLKYKTISDISIDQLDRVWVSIAYNHDRLYYSAPGSTHFTLFDGIPFDSVFSGCVFSFDLDNRLWASVFGDKAYGYDFRDSTMFFQTDKNPGTRNERFFRRAYADHSGKVWLPSDGFVTVNYPKGFKSYQHELPFHQTLNCITPTPDILWLGVREEGMLRIDRRTNTVERFSTHGIGKYYHPVNLIGEILPLRDGNLLIIAFDFVYTIKGDGTLIDNFPIPGTNRGGFQDSKGRVWIGTIGGWHLFDVKKGIQKSFRLPPVLDDRRNFIQAFDEDRNGMIWIASGGMGLVRFNPETEEINHFQHTKDEVRPLPTNNVLDISIDRNNMVWVATDLGLLQIHATTFETEFYDTKSGIASTNIVGVVCSDDGMVWLAGNAGVSSLDPATKAIKNYTHGDGMLNISINDRVIAIGADGVIYVGGKNGLDYFHPRDLRINTTAPIMRLTNVSLIRDGVTHTFPHQKTQLKLSYRDDLVAVEFSGMYYTDQENVRYRYKLEPLHKEWVDLGTEHKVLFSNLKPGNYTFRAKAITPDGISSEVDLALPIVVTPPFYQTVVFRFLLFCVILAFVIGYVRYRERLVKRKEQQESEVSRKLMELEKRALQAQMNPHFIYNSMNSIQQFILMHDTEGAMKYLTRFSRILRTVLNMSSQSRIPLYEEIKLIEDYIELESMRFPNKFTYKIDVSPELNIHAVEIPPFFIQPQVENAIRHGLLRKETPGHLHIELMKEGETLHITVEDNGIGREASRASKFNEVNKHESRGLGIIEERLKYLNSPNGHEPFKIIDLYDAERKSIGTRVEITLPMD